MIPCINKSHTHTQTQSKMAASCLGWLSRAQTLVFRLERCYFISSSVSGGPRVCIYVWIVGLSIWKQRPSEGGELLSPPGKDHFINITTNIQRCGGAPPQEALVWLLLPSVFGFHVWRPSGLQTSGRGAAVLPTRGLLWNPRTLFAIRTSCSFCTHWRVPFLLTSIKEHSNSVIICLSCS